MSNNLVHTIWKLIMLLIALGAMVTAKKNNSTNVAKLIMESLESLFVSADGNNWRWNNVTMLNLGVPWNFTKNGDGSYAASACDNWQGICCASDYITTSTRCQNFAANVRVSDDFELGVSEDQILVLYLEAMKLDGTLPPKLFNISTIQYLSIIDNERLIGTIPVGITNLVNMTFLSLGVNNLYGIIPPLTQFSYLQYLDIHHNNIHGTIPALTALSALEYIKLYSNQLEGTIPSLTGLSSVVSLNVYENNLQGTIPALSGLSMLGYLGLYDNYLEGTIPDVGELSSLIYLDLYGNYIDGAIPDLAGLIKMTYLDLFSNHIEGTIPALTGLMSLTYVGLNNNYLHGPISVFSSQLTYLSQVLLYNNFLSGSIPGFDSFPVVLVYLAMNNNCFEGSLSSTVNHLKNLTALNIQNNYFTGSLPKELSELTKLTAILAHNNQFTGSPGRTLPPSLTSIDISINGFSGTFPMELFSFSNISHVSMVQNCFSGSLSDSMCDASRTIESLALDGLTSGNPCRKPLLWGMSGTFTVQRFMLGSIPSCLFAMSKLISLGLSGNGFTGKLPDSNNLVISPSLRNVSLSYNQLSGTIPHSFQLLPLTVLDLAHNKLSGTLGALSRYFSNTRMDPFALNHSLLLLSSHSNNKSLSLQVNRLSGVIPSQYHDEHSISVVSGNLFDCARVTELPVHDPGSPHTQCGSFDLNIGLGVWLCATVAAVLFLLVLIGIGAVSYAQVDQFLKLAVISIERSTNVFTTLNWFNRMMFQYILWLFVALLIFLSCDLPLKSAHSNLYSTHTFQYAYTPSLAFLVGDEAAAVILVVTMLTMGLLWLTIRYNHSKDKLEEINVEEEEVVVDKQWVQWTELLLWAVVVLIDAVVILTVNSCYIMISLYYSQTDAYLAVVALVVFKLTWNMTVLPMAVQQLEAHISSKSKSKSRSTVSSSMMMASLVLFNNVLIPVIVTMCTQPLCFYNVFVAASDIVVNVEYGMPVTLIGVKGLRIVYLPQLEALSFQPPFVYSYQCSSSLITYYVPMYVIMYVYQGLISPGVSLLITILHQHPGITGPLAKGVLKLLRCDLMESRQYHHRWAVNEVSTTALALTTKSQNQLRSNDRDKSREDLLANMQDVAAVLTCHLATMLTFGLAYPLLSVLICLAGCVEIIQWRVLIGRYLSFCRDEAIAADQRRAMVSRLETSCAGVGDMLHQSRWLLLVAMSLFFSLFLLDMAGDRARDNWRRSLWAPLTLLLWPVCLLLCEVTLCRALHRPNSGNSNSCRRRGSDRGRGSDVSSAAREWAGTQSGEVAMTLTTASVNIHSDISCADNKQATSNPMLTSDPLQ